MRSREELVHDAVEASRQLSGFTSLLSRQVHDIRDVYDENARLRGLVEDGWRQGWRCGYSVCCANLDPTTQQMDADWKASPVKAALGDEPT